MIDVKVIKARQATYDNPIKISENQTIKTGKTDDEYPGWIWCTDNDGISGWVPLAYLKTENGTAQALQDYDASELTVELGQILRMHITESGWALCTQKDGLSGWVPLENLEITKHNYQ